MKTSRQKEGRAKWVHEDVLLNHRLTWLGLTQAILFAAYGIAIQQLASEKADACTKDYRQLVDHLLNGLKAIGLFTSILIFIGALAATVAMAKIKKEFSLPTYGISLSTTIAGWVCAVGLPYEFSTTWGFLIGIKFGCVILVLLGIFIAVTWMRVLHNNENLTKRIKRTSGYSRTRGKAKFLQCFNCG